MAPQDDFTHLEPSQSLTLICLMDFVILIYIYLTSPFPFSGVSGVFFFFVFILFLIEIPVSKQCRP